MTLRRDPPPRPPTYRQVLGCITLDLTDIDNLLRVLRDHASQVNVRLGDVTADEAVDLKEATVRELWQLTISTLSPTVRVALRQDEASVSTVENEPAARELVDDVFYLLSQRKSPKAIMRAVWYPIQLAAWLVSMLVVSTVTNNAPVAAIIIALLLPGSLVVRRNFKHMHMNGLATVIPRMRSERRQISQQTRQSLTTGTIIALLGIVINLLIAHGK